MIDWSKLLPEWSTKNRSFEELCYQLAKTLYGEETRFVSVDDSGGGDGVEFYATFPGGAQWGWQAKFFYPDGRLSGSRKTQIKKSLRKACKMHPNLTKFFLCAPSDLTPGERKWFENTLPKSRLNGEPVVPKGRELELEFWGHSELSAWLSEERFAGKRLYFFEELELSMNWFRDQFEKQTRGVREKYDRSLHTQTWAEEYVDALLGNGRLADDLGRRLTTLREDLAGYDHRCAELAEGPRLFEEWIEGAVDDIPSVERSTLARGENKL